MIDQLLQTLVQELNRYLKNTYSIEEPLVELSPMSWPDGSMKNQEKNKVLCTLVNIQKETMSTNRPVLRKGLNNQLLQLNFSILFAVHYDANHYVESLRVLSNIISFFEERPSFSPQNTSPFPNTISKASLEFQNLEQHEIAQLWASLGSKYQPSVLYKCRMLTIEDGRIIEEIPAIGEVRTSTRNEE